MYPGYNPPGAVAIMKQLELMHDTQREILSELKKINAPKDGIVSQKRKVV